MKKQVRPIILALIVFAVVGYQFWKKIEADRLSPRDVILGNGVIEATEVEISAKVSGRILTLPVHEGDDVRAGQLIATLDSGELQGQEAQAQGNLQAVEAALAELRAGTRAEDIRRAQAQFDAARETLCQAQARRDLIRAGARTELLAQLRAAYATANAQLALVTAGPRKETIAQLRAAYAQAQARLALLRAGVRPEEIAQLRAGLKQAQARLALVKSGARAEQLAQLRANLEQAQARLALVKAGARPEQLAQLHAGVEQAAATLNDAETELKRAVNLYALGAIPGQRVDTARTRRDVAAAQVRQAKEKLAEAQAGARPEEIQEVEQAAEAARQRLAEAQAGARPEEIQEAEQAVEAAQQRLAAARTGARPEEIAEVEQVAEAARQRLAEAQTGARPEEIHAARAQAEVARQRLAEAQAGPRPQERREADAAVAQAQAQVDAARATLDLAQAGPRRETIDAAQARVAQARGTVKTAVTTREQTQIYAPTAGRVMLRNVEPGELVTPGLPIIKLAALQQVWLRIYVPEPRYGSVCIGQRAEVITDTTNKRYTGTVTEIAQEPEFTPKNVQTTEERVKLVYGVKITIDNPTRALKPGMPADARIFLAEK